MAENKIKNVDIAFSDGMTFGEFCREIKGNCSQSEEYQHDKGIVLFKITVVNGEKKHQLGRMIDSQFDSAERSQLKNKYRKELYKYILSLES